jgi:hypothetical protein
MKIYQIAGKQYAVSGDDLFEKVPEFSQEQEVVDNAPGASPLLTVRKAVHVSVSKLGKSKQMPGRGNRSGKSKYDPDEIVTLARRVANKGMTPQDAADKLGVSLANWYFLRKKYAGNEVAKAAAPERREVLNAEEIREKVVEMQKKGMT